MKKIFSMTIVMVLIYTAATAQESGDVVTDGNTALKMLNTIQNYSLAQPGIQLPAANSPVERHTGQFSGTCEKGAFVIFSPVLIYTVNGKLVRTELPRYALFDKNRNGTWSNPGWDLVIPAGAKDPSLGVLLDSYTLIPHGNILMNRTMSNRHQFFKIKMPLIIPKVIPGNLKEPVKVKVPVKKKF